MKISDTGLAIVQAFEGCHRAVPGRPGYFKAYKDPIGVLTIGWGHTNHHEPKFDAATVWSQEQCDEALRVDLAGFERAVERHVTVALKQHQFDALVSFAYNCGEGNLRKSTLLKRVNAGDFKAAAAEFAKWNKAGGKVLAGLTRRRRAEARLFAGAVNEALQVAGAKRPPTTAPAKPAPAPKPAPVNGGKAPAVIPPPAPPPPDVEPVEPRAPAEHWFMRLLRAIFGRWG